MNAGIISFDTPSVVGECNLNENIFGVDYRPDVVSAVIRWQLAKRRSGCHKTKGISDISGTTKKPYRQKGTGRARQGSLRSPQFRGGAVIFGPVVRDHGFSLNKKFRALGIKVALSLKMLSGRICAIANCEFSSPKTADFKRWITDHEVLNDAKSVLFIVRDVDSNLRLATSNLFAINILPVIGVNVYDLLKHDYVVIDVEALSGLNERLLFI